MMDLTAILLLLLLSAANTQEVTTPSSLLRPRNFNHHPYDVENVLENQKMPDTVPTKQGPVLFPNDAPPPPLTPLIVTSRPLVESIARSELNPNNTVTAQSRVNGAFVPAYLGRVKAYTPFGRPDATSYTFQNDYQTGGNSPSIHLPKAQANQRQPTQYYQVNQSVPRQDNDVNADSSSNYNHGENYAFSYTVKDRERGDDFSHSQHSSGSATNGEYRVRLPDGRMQIVSYTADENGYKADVRYDDDNNDYQNNYNLPKQNNYIQKQYENHHNTVDDYNAKASPIYSNNNVNNYQSLNNDYIPKTTPAYIDNKLNEYNIHRNDNNFKITNDFNTKIPYVDFKSNNDNTNDLIANIHNNGYAKTTQGYVDNNINGNSFNAKEYDKQYKVKDKDYNSDVSKEYFNDDYSSEYNVKYEPHTSKYTSLLPKLKDSVQLSTVKPSYDDIRNLFTKDAFKTQQNYDNDYTTRNQIDDKIHVTYRPEYRSTPIYVPDFDFTTHSPLEYTTERTVLIGGKRPVLFTDIKSSIPSLTGNTFVSSTPSYLVSTISSFKNNFNPTVLSNKFIDKIQKYLSFK